MAEQKLVIQALDERELLKKKIDQRIEKLVCVDYAKNNEEKGIDSQKSREEFAAEAKAAYQQIMDLIARYEKVEAAIVASNAATVIQTSFGEYTVAAAIALRSRLPLREKRRMPPFVNVVRRELLSEEERLNETDFEEHLAEVMTKQFLAARTAVDEKNKILEGQAEAMRLGILGKDVRVKDDRPLAVVDAYIRDNRAGLLDPLDVTKRAEELRVRNAALLKEIESQIKIMNATTLVEID